MAILPLVIAPDPRLKTRSSPVTAFDEELKRLALDMLETMYHERGVGLAAVQVGEMKRLIVIDVEWKAEGDAGRQYIFVNPEITETSTEMNGYQEGCLSFPEQFSDVQRPKTARVKYQDLLGAWHELEADGLLATCIQHEIDHINGVTFVDRISRLKRDIILRRLAKMKKAGYFDPDHDHEDCGHEHHHHDHVHDEHCNH